MPLQVLSSSFPSPFFPLLNCSFPSGVSYCRYFITVFFKHLTHHLFLVHPFLSAALNLLVKWWRIDPASRSWRLLRLGERSFSSFSSALFTCSTSSRSVVQISQSNYRPSARSVPDTSNRMCLWGHEAEIQDFGLFSASSSCHMMVFVSARRWPSTWTFTVNRLTLFLHLPVLMCFHITQLIVL